MTDQHDKLRALSAKWREDARGSRDVGSYGIAAGREDCADELDAILAEPAADGDAFSGRLLTVGGVTFGVPAQFYARIEKALAEPAALPVGGELRIALDKVRVARQQYERVAQECTAPASAGAPEAVLFSALTTAHAAISALESLYAAPLAAAPTVDDAAMERIERNLQTWLDWCAKHGEEPEARSGARYAVEALQAATLPTPEQPAQRGEGDALHRMNGDLCEFAMRWQIDGDYMRCRACTRVQCASYFAEDFQHADDCRAKDPEPRPWAHYIGLLHPIIITPTVPDGDGLPSDLRELVREAITVACAANPDRWRIVLARFDSWSHSRLASTGQAPDGYVLVPRVISEVEADMIGMPRAWYERAVKTLSRASTPYVADQPGQQS